MALSINKLLPVVDGSENGYNSYSFRQELEAQLNIIKNDPNTVEVPMEGIEHIRHRGDLATWLLSKKIPENYHWVVARINGLDSAFEFNGLKRTVLVPRITLIDDMLQRHLSRFN